MRVSKACQTLCIFGTMQDQNDPTACMFSCWGKAAAFTKLNLGRIITERLSGVRASGNTVFQYLTLNNRCVEPRRGSHTRASHMLQKYPTFNGARVARLQTHSKQIITFLIISILAPLGGASCPDASPRDVGHPAGTTTSVPVCLLFSCCFGRTVWVNLTCPFRACLFNMYVCVIHINRDASGGLCFFLTQSWDSKTHSTVARLQLSRQAFFDLVTKAKSVLLYNVRWLSLII